VPDQSQSNESVSGKTNQTVGNPADTAANSPEAATAESLASNVNRASEGEMAQADQTINGDPSATTGDAQTAGATDTYDDENEWPYRKLQSHAKDQDVEAGGKREEIVARLRAKASGGTSDVPRADVDPQVVENGGIQTTGFGQAHAEILQGLSADRRKQQLAAVADRSSNSGADED